MTKYLFGAGQLWRQMTDIRRFNAGVRAVRAVQESKLRGIVHANRQTLYGRECGFSAIRNVREFQAAVPISTYETIEPYLQKMMRGERNVLTGEQPLMFAQTSGTTGRSKFIPFTPSYLAEYSHAFQVHTWHMMRDYPAIRLGKMLVLSSCDVEGHTEGGIPYGAISGFMARRQPALVQKFYALPCDIASIKDLEAKYYLALRLALQQDVRYPVSVSPSSLVLLAEKMSLHTERLIRDINDGGLSRSVSLPAAVLQAMRDRLRPNAARARELARLAEQRGSLRPMDAWPNLCAISCWKGGTMSLYLERLKELWGNVPIRDLGYGASEGRGSIPLSDDGAAGALAVTTHFFEFIPVDEIDNEHPTCLTGDQLTLDREYFILMTTSGGMYRYHINDVVRVTGYYHQAPQIVFVRKGRGVSSITGEKLTESQVTASVLTATASTAINFRYFTAAPRWDSPPYYLLLVEPDGDHSTQKLERFLAAMDRALMDANCEYSGRRESGRLGAPVLQLLEPGTFDRYRQERVLQGIPETQIKVPHLSSDLDFGSQFESRGMPKLTLGQVQLQRGVA